MITKREFNAYETVRASGITNMFAVDAVTKYAKKFCNVTLERAMIVEIMKNYSELKTTYGGNEQ